MTIGWSMMSFRLKLMKLNVEIEIVEIQNFVKSQCTNGKMF